MQPIHSLCNPSAGQFRLGLSRQKCLVRLVRPTQADAETSGQLGIYSLSPTTTSLLTLALAFEICALASRPTRIISGRLET